MAMSKEEILARIQEGAKTMNTPEIDPSVIAKIQNEQGQRAQEGWNLPIQPAKPDPEASANQIIQDHIAQMKAQQMPQNNGNQMQNQAAKQAALQQMIQSHQGNGINPDTGMPYFSAQPAAAPESPDDAARKQQMQFKMQYLKDKSQQGQ